MREIHKKTYAAEFAAIFSGAKTFDCRLADFDCRAGDILILDEIDDSRNPTGRSIRKKVGFVGKTRDFAKWHKAEDIEKYGYQIISLLEDEK